MKRKLFTFCTLFSLLLAAGTGLWWWRSAAKVDQVTLERPGKDTLRLTGTDGKLLLTRTVLPAVAPTAAAKSKKDPHNSWLGDPDSATRAPKPAPDAQLNWASFQPNAPGNPTTDPKFRLTSFSFASLPVPNSIGGVETTFVLPVWMITTVFAILPLLWVGTRFKKKKPTYQA